MGLLRVLLAISVFMAHSPQTHFTSAIAGFRGDNAVEIFFMISGFYIALILNNSYSSKFRFYKNRFLRLYPIYYTICILVILRALIFPLYGVPLFSFPTKVLAIGTFANSTFIGSDWLMFLQWHNNQLHFGSYQNSELQLWHVLLVPQSWSIGIEVAFYLLAPVLCKFKTRTIIIIGSLLLIGRFSGIFFGLNQDPWTYRFFPFELPMFLIGILMYRFRIIKKDSPKIELKKIYTAIIIFYISFAFLAGRVITNRLWQIASLIAMTSIILIWGEDKYQDKRIGELSYPIYVSHVLVISTYNSLAQTLSGRFPAFTFLGDPLVAIPSTLTITILLSLLLIYLAKPIEQRRNLNRN
jgi:peptidoglycan/LPS O-acetylase OafA/YrhL